jgi:hypothetical protein
MAFPRPLATVVQDSVAKLGLAAKLREAEIWRIWPNVVGEAIAQKAAPLRIINGTLTVAVSSSPWLQELRFMTGMMKDKLNTELGQDVVKEIVLKTGRVEKLSAEEPETVPILQPLTTSQQQYIDEHAVLIQDPETRQAFIELMQTALQLTPAL